MAAVLTLSGAGARVGTRWLWRGLDLTVRPGEFLTVLGPNGSGKTTLLRILLGLQGLAEGSMTMASGPAGYIPQQKAFDPALPLRGRDLVRLGADGHRWGTGLPDRRRARRVEAAITAVGAEGFARTPVGLLSGGEQQRLRVAQAIVADPGLLLCDEPLLSLDLRHQQEVVQLVARQRRRGTAVVFVTHEVNPVLPVTDRVLYLAAGRWAIGTPAEVLSPATLSRLYGTEVDVVEVRGRIVVLVDAAREREVLA